MVRGWIGGSSSPSSVLGCALSPVLHVLAHHVDCDAGFWRVWLCG